MNNRVCLNCSEPLKGRSDQKFCCDQCRSTYNNLIHSDLNAVINPINRILKKNYYILSTLNNKGKSSISKVSLMSMGYRFEFYTSTHITRNNQLSYYCYDIGYRENHNHNLTLLHLDLNKESHAIDIE